MSDDQIRDSFNLATLAQFQPGDGLQIMIGGIIVRSDKGKLAHLARSIVIAELEGLSDEAVIPIFAAMRGSPKIRECQESLAQAVEEALFEFGLVTLTSTSPKWMKAKGEAPSEE